MNRRNFFQALGAVVGAIAIGRKALPAPGAAPAVLPAVVPPPFHVPKGMVVNAFVKTSEWCDFRSCTWFDDGSYMEDGVYVKNPLPCPVVFKQRDECIQLLVAEDLDKTPYGLMFDDLVYVDYSVASKDDSGIYVNLIGPTLGEAHVTYDKGQRRNPEVG